MVYHTKYKTLHCVACQVAWLPSAILGHLKSKHDLSVPHGEEQLAAVTTELELIQHFTQLVEPHPDGPPIEMLAVHDGFRCSKCPYAAKAKKSVSNHLVKHKKDNIRGPIPIQTAHVQAFFYPSPKRFFAVNPALAPSCNDSPYQVFLQKIFPTIPKPFKPMSMDKSDVDPLVQMTRWHVHLEPFVQSRDAVDQLVALAKTPEKNDQVYGHLHDYVRGYLKATRAAANGVQFSILCMLDHYPLCVDFMALMFIS